MSTIYENYSVVVTYLKKYANKSYRGFLNLYCEDIIALSPFSDDWRYLDDFWALNFLKEAEKLDKSTYNALKEKVKFERSGKWLKSYWEGVIEKCRRLTGTGSTSKVHDLRKRCNIDYNEERMAKRIMMNVRSQSTQSTQFSSDEEVINNNINKVKDEQINDLTQFNLTYHNLDPEKMWTLKSGRVVEKVIYEYACNLPYESCLHSFIINDVDKDAKALFQKEEWEEMFSFNNFKEAPKINKSVFDLMKKYSITDLSLFQNIIFEPFLPTGTSYSNKEHFDLNYINLAYRAIHTLWEDDDDFTLDPSRLEGWFQYNIWSPIIDPIFRNSKINLIRGEGMSMASSDRKNDASCDAGRKKIGRKGDGIFRLKGDRLEFGAIEAGRKWEGKNGKKYLNDSLKLGKMLRDMLMQLIAECNSDEQTIRQLQTVGMLHGANRFQLLTIDTPKGYICRIQRFDFHEVPSRINNPLLAFVLKDILKAKAIIMQTLELVQGKKSNPSDLDDSVGDKEEVERLNRCTTPPTFTLPSTFKTP